MDHLRCSTCGESKPSAEFNNNQTKATGKSDACRPCHRQKASDYYYANKEKRAQKMKEWREKNRDHIKQFCRERRRANEPYAIGERLRIRLWQAIRGKVKKPVSAVRDLGCELDYFKLYIAAMFKEGMTWDNYGKVWHLDHRRPLALVDWTSVEQARAAVHYTNLQPLFVHENLSKGKRYHDCT